ncbi:hypothetical protein J2X72_004072 [Phyllobacterium sp. 1468]|nr:hypothetical protein [Phyllobacterium sp. 1468]
MGSSTKNRIFVTGFTRVCLVPSIDVRGNPENRLIG